MLKEIRAKGLVDLENQENFQKIQSYQRTKEKGSSSDIALENRSYSVYTLISFE